MVDTSWALAFPGFPASLIKIQISIQGEPSPNQEQPSPLKRPYFKG
jgi:hypothetical protein